MEVEEGDGAGGLELVESFTGLAPIVDAVVLGGEGEESAGGVSLSFSYHLRFSPF